MIPLVIGLTGGIGSGKTTVAEILSSFGASVIDVDKIGREILELESSVAKEVIRHFGNVVIREDGFVDRKKLGEIVFSNPNELEALEAISHPAINRVIQSCILGESSKIVVLDMAILVEKNLGYDGLTPMYHKVVVVQSERDIRIERLKKRGLTAIQINDRFNSQASDEERSSLADVVVSNNGSMEELKSAVEELWRIVENWQETAANDCMEE
tara:strand:- start:337 stop:975 length:639 start_codon:yes stop_codon:yes gene_type:complete